MYIYRILFSLFVLAAFLPTGIVTAADSTDIRIEGVEAEFSAMRPDVGVIFMKIKNEGKTEDALIEVSVDIKGVKAELHDVKNNSMMKVDRINIPAKSSITLKKGSFHIMLFNLPVEVKEGQEFSVSLKFEKSGESKIKAKFAGKSHEMHNH
jgi:copper(I)-binding protein